MRFIISRRVGVGEGEPVGAGDSEFSGPQKHLKKIILNKIKINDKSSHPCGFAVSNTSHHTAVTPKGD